MLLEWTTSTYYCAEPLFKKEGFCALRFAINRNLRTLLCNISKANS